MGRTHRKRGQRKKSLALLSEASPSFISELFKSLSALGWKNDTNLSIRNFKITGRGLCSKKLHVAEGDELMRLPLKCLITIATLQDDSDFKAQFNIEKFTKDQRVPFQCLMALYVLHRQHSSEKSSYHNAYLNSVPGQFTMPYFCPINELQCLPEAILEKTVAQNRKIRDSFARLKSVFKEENCTCCGKKYFNDIYTLDAFKWAYFAVNSRSIYVHSRQVKPDKGSFEALLGDEVNLALAPFLDLFNHSDEVATTAELVRTERKQLEFVLTLDRAPSTTKPYSQLYISYGALTNLKLLTDYGFLLPHNKHDYFELSLLDIENFVNGEKCFSERTFHRNKFKFIRDHNLHDQMFFHSSDGMSHNLRVVLNLILKEPSHYPNVLNQVAFGAVEQLEDVTEEAQLLIAFKISEYQRFMADLEKLPKLSRSGLLAVGYMQECIRYLRQCAKLLE